MAAAISFERVTKDFRGVRKYRALRDELSAAPRLLLGGKRPKRSVVRALDDISFEIRESESFGIIGPNGAGKTTALKIATRISFPTKGRVRVRGRVGALIEVGTGMHPELTGRENVQLYGRILGLRGRDIDRRFDQIVDFSGIGATIDQPVKQYSSGQQLRLGFSLASHLEPDVLLVDEALSVGDAAFQYRCVEKMNELVQSGRTLVFVSHDMSVIESLCTRAILLARGQVVMDGPARDVVAHYLRGVDQQQLGIADPKKLAHASPLQVVGITVLDSAGREVDAVPADQPMTIRVHYRASERIEQPQFSVGFGDGRRGAFAGASMLYDGEAPDHVEGEGYVDCTFENLPVYPRVYEIWCGVRGRHAQVNLFRWQRVRLLDVTGESGLGKTANSWSLRTPVRIPYRWNLDGVHE